MAAAAAAALVIGVGGRGASFDAQTTLALAGPTGCRRQRRLRIVEQGDAADARSRSTTCARRRAARTTRCGSGAGDKVSAVTFNTSYSGKATIRTAISADMHWGNCWVTLEKVGDPAEATAVVLRST